jgi:hypothetical protein
MNLLVHLVAGDADGGAHDDAAQSDDGHLGGAAADVDDEAASGLHDGQAGADGRRHGLLHQVGGTGAGVERGIVDGPLLHLGHAAGDADHHAGPRDAEAEAVVDGADEVLEHALRDLEVRDDAVFEGPHGDDVGWRAAHHALGFGADGQDLLAVAVHGHHGRLIDDDAASLHHDQGVGGAQVNADVVGEEAEEGGEGVESQGLLRGQSCHSESAAGGRRI